MLFLCLFLKSLIICSLLPAEVSPYSPAWGSPAPATQDLRFQFIIFSEREAKINHSESNLTDSEMSPFAEETAQNCVQQQPWLTAWFLLSSLTAINGAIPSRCVCCSARRQPHLEQQGDPGTGRVAPCSALCSCWPLLPAGVSVPVAIYQHDGPSEKQRLLALRAKGLGCCSAARHQYGVW